MHGEAALIAYVAANTRSAKAQPALGVCIRLYLSALFPSIRPFSFFLATTLSASIIHPRSHTSPIFISGVSAPKIKAEAPTETFSSPANPIQLLHPIPTLTLHSVSLILVVSRYPLAIRANLFPVIVWKRKKAFALPNRGCNTLVMFKSLLNHLHL
jgi:hypothetical protein